MVENKDVLNLPGLGKILMNNGMKRLVATSDGTFHVGKDDVQSIISTGDGKVEFVSFPEKTLACVLSAMGYPAYYPVLDVEIKKPVKAVLMDLDGTSVKSEGFWGVDHSAKHLKPFGKSEV